MEVPRIADRAVPRRENISGKCARFGCRVNGRRRRVGALLSGCGYGCSLDHCASLLKFGLLPPSMLSRLLSVTVAPLFTDPDEWPGVLLLTKRARKEEADLDQAISIVMKICGAFGSSYATELDTMREVYCLAMEYGCNGRTSFRIATRFRQVDPLGYASLAEALGRDPHAGVKARSIDDTISALRQRLLASNDARARLLGLRWYEDPSEAHLLLRRATPSVVPGASTWRERPTPRRYRHRLPSILWDVDFHAEHGRTDIESYWDEVQFLARERDALWAEVQRLPVGWQDWL